MQKSPLLLDYSEGIDRKVLRSLTHRFLEVSNGRLERARSVLTWRQRTVLDLLALMFHLNHPALPGYLSGDCPSGLQVYEPDDRALEAARRQVRSFQPSRRPARNRDLTGIFLMGSPGSLGQSVTSDLDVWLCHRGDLDEAGVGLLKAKAGKVSRWAAGFGLELNIFVFSAEAFNSGRYTGEVSRESSGSAQHYLLLDEFYRTAIHLGGGVPLWWLIPPEQEARYRELADRLTGQRFVKAGEYLDFGPVAAIPREEFLGAGIWQLYKGIGSPWKSLLKLLLIECYAGDPERGPLSADFKWAVYQGRLALDELDAYAMLYRRLEHWLHKAGTPERLGIVRRALYLKTGLPLTRAEEVAGRWQGQLLSELVREWGWSDRDLKDLDQRHQWRYEQVRVQRRQIAAELIHSYRMLSVMAREQQLAARIRPGDLNLLGRKLSAAFQRQAGKVERINPGIAPSLAEENLSFCFRAPDGEPEWLLFRDLAHSPESLVRPPIRRSGSLVEMLLWCHWNGLLTRATRLNLRSGTLPLTLAGVQALVSFLADWLADPGEVSREALADRRYPLRYLLLINVETGSPAEQELPGQAALPGVDSGQGNRVLTVDVVGLNSWHEASLQRYLTGEALLQALVRMLGETARRPDRVPDVRVYCAGGSYAHPVVHRVAELVRDLFGRFFAGGSGPHPLRYVLELDNRYFVFRFEGDRPRMNALPDMPALLDYLARPLPGYCPVVFDRYTLTRDPVTVQVCQSSQPGLVQVFFQVVGSRVRLWVVDELGSVLSWQQPVTGQKAGVLVPLLRFLENLRKRCILRQAADPVREARCTELRLEQGRVLSLPWAAAPETGPETGTGIMAVGVLQRDGSIGFDLYCNGQKFDCESRGRAAQMDAVARWLRDQQPEAETAPYGVTDLQLPPGPGQENLQTSQYIRYWQQLQKALAQALRRL